MQFEKTKKMLEYWQNLKGDRQAPARNEIEPSDIRSLLGDTFILEINHKLKIVIYRLAGTRLCEAYGRELKGLGFLTPWNEEDNLAVLQAITNTYASFTPNCLNHYAKTEHGRFTEYETLLLPLAPVPDGTSRVIGITSPKKPAFWHGVEPITSNKLRSVRQPVSPPHQTKAISPDKKFGLPYLTPPPMDPPQLMPYYACDQSSIRTVKHLTVLDGGKV